jgi:hypothetical protein
MSEKFPEKMSRLQRVGEYGEAAMYIDTANRTVWFVFPNDIHAIDELDGSLVNFLFQSLSDRGLQDLGHKIVKETSARSQGSIADRAMQEIAGG